MWGGGPSLRRSLGWRTVNLDGVNVTFCELCFGKLTGARPSNMAILRLQQSGRLLVQAHYLDPTNHEIYHKLNELDRLLWGLGAPPQFAWP